MWDYIGRLWNHFSIRGLKEEGVYKLSFTLTPMWFEIILGVFGTTLHRMLKEKGIYKLSFTSTPKRMWDYIRWFWNHFSIEGLKEESVYKPFLTSTPKQCEILRIFDTTRKTLYLAGQK